MKKSLYFASSLIIFLWLCDKIIYQGLTTIDKKVFTGQSVGKVNHFLSLKDSVNFLVFGSSRANRHVNNFFVDSSSFNVAMDGRKIACSAALVSCLNKKEQTILIHIDPEEIFDPEYTGSDCLSLGNLFHRNEAIKKTINEIFPYEVLFFKLFYCYAYRNKVLGMLFNYFKPKYDYQTYSGHDPIYPTVAQVAIFKNLIKRSQQSLSKENDYNVNLETPNKVVNKSIDQIISICTRNQSKVIFFTSPTLKPASSSTMEAAKEYFQTRRIDYYNYSNFLPDSNIENWRDFTHLSHKGADLFTKELKKIIFL